MRYAVVTGASSGIGEEFAKAFYKKGYRVILVARRKERLLALQRELTALNGAGVEIMVCNLAQEEDCRTLAKACYGKRIDYFVNAAGFGTVGWFRSYPLERDLEMLNVNLKAVVFLTKLLLKYMKSGKIINLASTAGFSPNPGMTVYGATKSFLISFGQGVNYELKQQKSLVRVITLCPGPVDTEFDSKAGSITTEKSKIRNYFKITTKDCVKQTFSGIQKGKDLIILGNANHCLNTISKVIPRNFLLAAKCRIQYAKFAKPLSGDTAKNRLKQEQNRTIQQKVKQK